MDLSTNPFCRPCDYTPSGYSCSMTADDRVFAIKTFDARELRQVLALDDLQRTVRRAAEARLRKLMKERA
mgnify:CR=1 FL=1